MSVLIFPVCSRNDHPGNLPARHIGHLRTRRHHNDHHTARQIWDPGQDHRLADGVSETQEGCISFAEEKGYHFPLFFDTFSEGFTAYGISAIPLTVAVNANGKIVASHLGAMNESQLQDIINLLIKP